MAYTHFEFNDGPDVRGFQLEAGRVKLYKGGGGMPAQTSSTVTQTNLPAYAEPYVTDIMERAQAQSYRPYTPYEGQRIAGFSDASFA